MENRSHALIAGLFTVLLGLAAVGALWWFGDSDEETRDYLVVTTRTVSGLNVQGQVRYRGIRVGKVAEIRLDPNDVRKTLIRIAIDRDIPLTAGTRAELGYQGVTGIAHVLLDDDGSDPRPLTGEGDALPRIPMQESLMQGLADNGREVLRQARELMNNVNALLDAENRRRISSTLANLEATTAEARAATAQLRSVLTPENVQKLEAILANAERTTAQAAPFFAEARGLVARLQAVGDKLDTALGEPSGAQGAGLLPRVDDLTRELSASSRQLGRVLQMLEESPQSLIFGRPEAPPGPGEPGFSAPSARAPDHKPEKSPAMNSCRPFPARHARALLAVGLLCAGLLGCGSLPSAPPPVEVYDFGPLPSRNLPARPWRLAVDVRMPAWYEALPIDYRLDYDDPLLQRAYTGSRWAAAPASLIARQLRRQLGLNDAGIAVNCFLRVEVEEFVQVFASPQDSRGVLNAVVTVLDERRRPMATLPQQLEVPAATPDARGGVRALVSTANRLGENIEAWLDRLEGEGRLVACRQAPG